MGKENKKTQIFENLTYEQIEDSKDALKELQTMKIGKTLSNDDINIMLANVHYCLSDIGHYEMVVERINDSKQGLLGAYEKILSYSDNPKIYTNKENIKLDTRDMEEIFRDNTIEKEKEPEKYAGARTERLANLLFWTNKLYHDLENMPKNMKPHYLKDIEKLRRIKDKCIAELIECKKNGENIFIEVRPEREAEWSDRKGLEVFSVALPNYFQPFEVHLNPKDKNQLSAEERSYCQDKIDYPAYAMYPFKVTQTKKELIQWIAENATNRDVKKEAPRNTLECYTWYVEMQKELERHSKMKDKIRKPEDKQVLSEKGEQRTKKKVAKDRNAKKSVEEEKIRAIKAEKDSIEVPQEETEKLKIEKIKVQNSGKVKDTSELGEQENLQKSTEKKEIPNLLSIRELRERVEANRNLKSNVEVTIKGRKRSIKGIRKTSKKYERIIRKMELKLEEGTSAELIEQIVEYRDELKELNQIKEEVEESLKILIEIKHDYEQTIKEHEEEIARLWEER